MIDDKVKIKCSKCSKMFRERAQRIRNDYQMQCPHCSKLITFDSSSEDNNIRRALRSARELRLSSAILALEATAPANEGYKGRQ
jgi:DNA-directed RNA polymerase subunit RPC12/RpoP